MDDDLVFAEESDATEQEPVSTEIWKVLVVDDEPDIHTVTKIALSGSEFLGRRLELSHAYSGAEAKSFLTEQADIAVVLLDVVMHIVYNLVTQGMGGTIECDSEEGEGTEFTIKIPLRVSHDLFGHWTRSGKPGNRRGHRDRKYRRRRAGAALPVWRRGHRDTGSYHQYSLCPQWLTASRQGAVRLGGRQYAGRARPGSRLSPARCHAKAATAAIVPTNRAPLQKLQDGRIVGVYPLDYVAWTPELGPLIKAANEDLGQVTDLKSKELWIEGTVSPEARKGFEAQGWAVKDRVQLLLDGSS